MSATTENREAGEVKTYTLEEQKANRKLWVEALRSGKFRQATERLRKRNGAMCCLGVLSSLAACEWTWSEVEKAYMADEHEDHDASKRARNFVGLATSSGEYEEDDNTLSLASENDAGKSFAEIADIIESEPAGLFISEGKQ